MQCIQAGHDRSLDSHGNAVLSPVRVDRPPAVERRTALVQPCTVLVYRLGVGILVFVPSGIIGHFVISLENKFK